LKTIVIVWQVVYRSHKKVEYLIVLMYMELTSFESYFIVHKALSTKFVQLFSVQKHSYSIYE